MLDVKELRVCMVRKNHTIKTLSGVCGVSDRAFRNWLQKRVLPTDKAAIIAKELQLENPAAIFFGQ